LQFKLKWLMVVVAVCAVILSLPGGALVVLGLLAIPAAMIALPSAVAPRGRRADIACWAMALHQLVLLAWLSLWRFVLDPMPLAQWNTGWYYGLTLEVPYVVTMFSCIYQPVLFLLILGFGHRYCTQRESVVLAMILMLFLWPLTWEVLSCDPFVMRDWVWD
jgi:hypothetical protein